MTCRNPDSSSVVSDCAHTMHAKACWTQQQDGGVCAAGVSDTHDGAGMWVQVYSVFAKVSPAVHSGPSPPSPYSHSHPCLPTF